MLTNSIPFSPDHLPDFFAQFPAAPAVFVLRGAEAGAEPYASKTANLKRRLLRLLAPPESQSKRLNLRERVATIDYSLTGSDFECVLLLYRTLRKEFPDTYQKRLRLRSASAIRFNLENEYPRAYVTTRIGRFTGKSLYYGPFRSRAVAEKFLNDSLDLFKMRRCTFNLNPDPAFPGCVYSEMKMCLAPCFKGCTDEAYAEEVARVQAYFDSGGQSLLQELEAERERLSATLDFEAAAAQHARITKIKGILAACDDICGRLDHLNAVIVQPSLEPKTVALFHFYRSELAGPVSFAVEAEDDSQSQESRIKAALEQTGPVGAPSAQRFMEELAILKRWYYRTHKVGEAFFSKNQLAKDLSTNDLSSEKLFSKDQNELPMRRIVRGVSRVYRGEKEQPAANSPAQPEEEEKTISVEHEASKLD